MANRIIKQLLFGITLIAATTLISVNAFGIGSTLYCYECISTHPGCDHQFNWWYYWSKACPEIDDKCVKIIETKGAEEIITRDCLSSLRAVRTDIPADHYEGCRPAAHDVKLAHYVNNSIKELDIKRCYSSQYQTQSGDVVLNMKKQKMEEKKKKKKRKRRKRKDVNGTE
ncbi:hypothetical protein LSTR_LSTR013077 [Laodelphax striatellus]|uniref:Protein quiver n=1 Tax=Laodelphax striatellus TaxID=195883 RepID=A0A482XLI8_LAOST|nr:hypothetical protein LSTR_LSTR013077 [Laodelphax striatellus]